MAPSSNLAMDSPPDPEKRNSFASGKDPETGIVAVNDLVSYASMQDGNALDTLAVGFDDNPLEDPQRWSRAFRWYLTAVLTLLNMVGNFATAAHTGLAAPLSEHLGMSAEPLTLSISLFVCGSCLGAFIWGPLSEQHGRRAVSICALLGFTAAHVGSALSPNVAAFEVFRFLAGLFIAPTACVNPGVLVDIWDAETREKTVVVTSISSYIGPAFPVILVDKAKRMRKETGDERYRAPMEQAPSSSAGPRGQGRVGSRFRHLHLHLHLHLLARPLILFFREPALIAVNLYIGFICGCLYMFFEVYPIVFQQGYHFSPSAVGLTFIPAVVGEIVGFVVYIYAIRRRYAAANIKAQARVQAGDATLSEEPDESPEAQLTLAIWAAPIYAAGYFWLGCAGSLYPFPYLAFGCQCYLESARLPPFPRTHVRTTAAAHRWTSFPSISFWAPLLSGLFIGLSAFWLTMALLNYIVVVYAPVIASALASATLVRGLFGTVLPLISDRMFGELSPRWASTIIGCVAVALAPVPLVLRRYGPALRARSRYIGAGECQ
ncbi:major facilitator superfamily domain-containing protein [Trametes meyenii]|nr:major facilitator superfamily domain-containing protein [Trametes meyenii]